MMLKSVILTMLLLISGVSVADPLCPPSAPTGKPQGFFISGILKKSEHGVTVKLVHLIEIARSEREAKEYFVSEVSANYPDYAIADMIISVAGRGMEDCHEPYTDKMI